MLLMQVLAIMAQAPWPRLPLPADGVLRVQLSLQVPPHTTSTHLTGLQFDTQVSQVTSTFYLVGQRNCHCDP